MFGARKCAEPPARLDGVVSVSDDGGEKRALAGLRCASGAALKYVASRPPSSKALAEATMSGKQLWMHDHAVICARCGAESVVTFARPGDQPPPSSVSVRSKSRADRYLVQHMLLPHAIFANPSDTLRRLIQEGVTFGNHLHDIGLRQLRMKGSGPPIQSTTTISSERFALVVAIEFTPPRAPGEAYYALAALKQGNDAPAYYLCERTGGYEDASIGAAAMLCSWSAGADNKPDAHLNFGELSQVDYGCFVEAALAHFS